MEWLKLLKYNPIQPLYSSGDSVLLYFVKRDLLQEHVPPTSYVWELDEVKKILKKQQHEGNWVSNRNNEPSFQNYNLIETWRYFRFLIEKYEMSNLHSCIRSSAEYLFSCQTNDGDFRGFLGNQYAAYYTGAILSLLIKAGYEEDTRIERGMKWLLSVRQDDGGWIGSPIFELPWKGQIDAITQNIELKKDWDRTKPLCLNSTGMILRAFSSHPTYRKSEEAIQAAKLLKRHFFMNNYYSSYRHKDHWLFFQFPYWWNNLVTALDSISTIIPDDNDEDIQRAVNWFIEHQEENGLWKTSYSSIHKNTITEKTRETQLWITFRICKILKGLYTDKSYE